MKIYSAFRYNRISKYLKKHKWFANTIAIIGVFLLTILFRVCVLELFAIPSESMEDTLLSGDKIIINKLVYGPRMPASPYEIPWINLIWYLKADDSTNRESKFNFAFSPTSSRHPLSIETLP